MVLTSGEVDAIAGLLALRERQVFAVYATERVHAVLDANPVFEVLSRDLVARHVVAPDRPCPLSLPSGASSGLSIELFAVPGKVPLYLEGAGTPEIEMNDQTVGVAVSDGASTLFYIPGCAAMAPALAARLRGAGVVMFDGTLWTDDEMVVAGLGQKTGARMGHMSIAGPTGTLAAFEGLDVRRRILIHLNNSNPVLLDDSREHALVEEAGWEVAFDGMELTL